MRIFITFTLVAAYLVALVKYGLCPPTAGETKRGLTEIGDADQTDITIARGRGSPIIDIPPETNTEREKRLKHELEIDQARTTIEIVTPIIRTLQAEKTSIINDLAIVAAGTRKQTQLLNRLYTIDTRIYTQTQKLEKAEHILENE